MNISKLFKSLFFGICFLAFLAPRALAEAPTLYFYYGIGCPHCAQVKPFIEEVVQKYPEIDVKQYEVYKNRVNAQRLLESFEEYGVPFGKRGVPVVFLNGTYFLGDTPIIDNLEGEIEKMLETADAEADSADEPEKTITSFESEEISTDPMEPQAEEGSSQPAEDSKKGAEKQPSESAESQKPEPVSLWVITGLALVDSVNPCAIAVLIILLGALMMVQKKKRALWGGLCFTTAIYISYFLFGLGISYTLQLAQSISFYIFKGVGILAIILGLANIKDFFWYGSGGFVMEIPRSWRPRLKSMLRGVTSPLGAFLVGFAVTLFELPCTGGPYFVVLGLLSAYESMAKVLPILFYYNFFFVLPLLVITGLVYLGLSSVQEAGKWKDRNIRILHLAAGLIMTGLGAYVLFV